MIALELNVVATGDLLFNRVWNLKIRTKASKDQIERVFSIRKPFEVAEVLVRATKVVPVLSERRIQNVGHAVVIVVGQGHSIRWRIQAAPAGESCTLQVVSTFVRKVIAEIHQAVPV